MANVDVHVNDIGLEQPTLIEGLPGIGLVGKITADHLVETFDMTHYASVRCEGIPQVTRYQAESTDIRAPVRLHADTEHDLLVLQSDIPISPSSAPEFATCITNWLDEHEATPLFLSGLPAEKNEEAPGLYGVATGTGKTLLDEVGIAPPSQDGLISGPTGVLLQHAQENNIDSVGLIVESNPQLPDPEAARSIIKQGIEPVAGIEVNTDNLIEQAEEIQSAREQLAQQMQQADDESSQAQPIRMFQ